MKITAFDYQSPRRFLAEYLTAHQATNPAFSIRQWAKQMEISHALLLMLLQGKRPIKLKHFPAIAKGLELTHSERVYLQAMIEWDSSANLQQKNVLQALLSDLHPGTGVKSLELEEFTAIADWIHFALISYCSVTPVQNCATRIARRFGKKTTPAIVSQAIERLIAMNLLKLTADGKIHSTDQHYKSANDVTNRAVREYHRQVAGLAQQAVFDQDVHEREFQAVSLTVAPEKMALAKELIRRFRDQFCEAMGEPENGFDVFQFNLHFFRLTESPLAMVAREDEGAETQLPATLESSHEQTH